MSCCLKPEMLGFKLLLVHRHAQTGKCPFLQYEYLEVADYYVAGKALCWEGLEHWLLTQMHPHLLPAHEHPPYAGAAMAQGTFMLCGHYIQAFTPKVRFRVQWRQGVESLPEQMGEEPLVAWSVTCTSSPEHVDSHECTCVCRRGPQGTLPRITVCFHVVVLPKM